MDLGGVPERVFKTHSCSDSLPTASQMDRVFGSDRYIAPHKMSEISVLLPIRWHLPGSASI
jgi:hypothetical protein